MPANPNHARHHVSFPPPPNLGLAASHEGQGSRQPRASEDRRTSKRSHLRCGVLEGAASLAHPRAARMCGQAGPETIRHVMSSIPACLNSLTERMSVGGMVGIGEGDETRTCSAEGGGLGATSRTTAVSIHLAISSRAWRPSTSSIRMRRGSVS